MKNLERMCTAAKGAEAFELAIVMFEIKKKKKKDLYSLRLTATLIIYTTVNIVLTEA